MDYKRSRVWTIFTSVGGEKAKCDLCKNLYSIKGGSTSNLRKHLLAKHLATYEQIFSLSTTSRVPEESSDRPVVLEPSTSGAEVRSEATSSQATQQTRISSFLKRPLHMSREKKINDLILDTIIRDFQPFTIVEDVGFKSLIRYLEPDYKLPSRYMLSTTFLDSKCAAVESKLKDELKNAAHISLTTDGWTARTKASYQAVTAHYLINWELKSALLGCFECQERHTGEYIKNEISGLLSKWNIKEKVFACVTDNAPNMISAVRLANLTHFSCVAHTLNLVVKSGLGTPEIEDIIQKIKAIVEHFNRSPMATKKLRNMQEQLRPGEKARKLKMDVATRWNSTLDMVERILLLQEPLEAVLGLLHNPVDSLLEEEWQVLPEIIKILKPFKEVTEQMSSQTKVTVSMVIAITDGICWKLRNQEISTQIGRNFLSEISRELNSRIENYPRHSILSQAALLDPRFKRLGFKDDSSYENAKRTLTTNVERILNRRPLESLISEAVSEEACRPEIREDSVWGRFDMTASSFRQSGVASSIIKVKRYIEENNISRQACPLKWWKSRAEVFPEISNLAEKYLSVMATSVPCERIFSKSGQLLNEKRSNLKASRVDKLLFLHVNSRLYADK